MSTTPDETTATRREARGYRKTREGLVVSDKMDKTVVVAVEDHVKHPKYGKVFAVPRSTRHTTSRTSVASATVYC